MTLSLLVLEFRIFRRIQIRDLRVTICSEDFFVDEDELLQIAARKIEASVARLGMVALSGASQILFGAVPQPFLIASFAHGISFLLLEG